MHTNCPSRRTPHPLDAVYYPYADCVFYFRTAPPYLTCVCLRLSFRRTSRYRYPLLQSGHLRELRSSARWSVRMDAIDKDLPIRTPYARRAMAPRPCERTLLLHRFNPARHSVARHLHYDDGFKSVIWNGPAHIPIPPHCAQREFSFSWEYSSWRAGLHNRQGHARPHGEERPHPF